MIYTEAENKYSYIKRFAYEIRGTICTNWLENINQNVDFEIEFNSLYLLITYVYFIRLILLSGSVLIYNLQRCKESRLLEWYRAEIVASDYEAVRRVRG